MMNMQHDECGGGSSASVHSNIEDDGDNDNNVIHGGS